MPSGYRIDDTNDGEYTVFYSARATISGGSTTFQLSVNFITGETATEIGGDCGDETLCPRSPFDATITAGAVSTNSSSTGEGLRDAQAGVDASFSVSCLDWWGNERVDMTSAGFFKGRLACAGPCEGPSSTPCSGPCSAALADRVDTSSTFNADEQLEFDLLPVGGGTYEGLYNIELAGSYLLTLVSPTAVNLVDANIRTLKNSPTTVVVVPSRSSAEQSLCTGAGLNTSVAGVAAELLVEPVADVISDYVIPMNISDFDHTQKRPRIPMNLKSESQDLGWAA